MDLSSAASLATAGGTLVLAVATFASVRSANRAARAAERSLLAGLRPLLVPSRSQEAPQKIAFVDDKWVMVPGGGAVAESEGEVLYLAASLRNVGSGIGVLHGWHFTPGYPQDESHPDPASFRRLTRDLYIAPGDAGFWQGAFRDETDPQFEGARKVIEARSPMTVDLLYGDHEGGQRMISRFLLRPRKDTDWWLTAARHWNVDRPDPR